VGQSQDNDSVMLQRVPVEVEVEAVCACCENVVGRRRSRCYCGEEVWKCGIEALCCCFTNKDASNIQSPKNIQNLPTADCDSPRCCELMLAAVSMALSVVLCRCNRQIC
jgi:hypothetical protein